MSLVLTAKVVGLTFGAEYPANIYKIAKRFAMGDDSITLVREPNNEVDKNAIAVHDGENPIGHIPRKIAELLSPQIDAGVKWFAAVDSIIVSQENVNQPGIKITLWSEENDE
jgi:hypothetical protein